MMKYMLTLIIGICIHSMALANPPDGVGGKPARQVPVTEAIPEEYAKTKEVAIVLEKLEQQEEMLGLKVTLRIINPTKKLLAYWGHTASRPNMELQLWKSGQWKESAELGPEPTKPGVSMGQFLVATGRSVTFEINVKAEHMPLRVSLDCMVGDQEITIFSDKIER